MAFRGREIWEQAGRISAHLDAGLPIQVRVEQNGTLRSFEYDIVRTTGDNVDRVVNMVRAEATWAHGGAVLPLGRAELVMDMISIVAVARTPVVAHHGEVVARPGDILSHQAIEPVQVNGFEIRSAVTILQLRGNGSNVNTELKETLIEAIRDTVGPSATIYADKRISKNDGSPANGINALTSMGFEPAASEATVPRSVIGGREEGKEYRVYVLKVSEFVRA